jgi:hypothetical protein
MSLSLAIYLSLQILREACHGGIFLLKSSCLLLLPVNRFAKGLVVALRATEILRRTSPLRFRSVFPLKKKLVNKMAMLNRSRATKKGGWKMLWDAEGPEVVFLFGQEFCGELEGLTKAEKYESDARYLQYNEQGFYKRIDDAVAQVLSFPTEFPSEHFRTKCLHYIDEVQ